MPTVPRTHISKTHRTPYRYLVTLALSYSHYSCSLSAPAPPPAHLLLEEGVGWLLVGHLVDERHRGGGLGYSHALLPPLLLLPIPDAPLLPVANHRGLPRRPVHATQRGPVGRLCVGRRLLLRLAVASPLLLAVPARLLAVAGGWRSLLQ